MAGIAAQVHKLEAHVISLQNVTRMLEIECIGHSKVKPIEAGESIKGKIELMAKQVIDMLERTTALEQAPVITGVNALEASMDQLQSTIGSLSGSAGVEIKKLTRAISKAPTLLDRTKALERHAVSMH